MSTATPQVVATVISVSGMAFARNADGAVRRLAAGDTILEGETVFTLAGGEIELAFADGHNATILASESYLMGPEAMIATSPDAGEAAITAAGEVGKVVTALEEGGDILEGLEAPAAGGPGENSGNDFVRLLRIVEPVSPVGYEYPLNTVGEIRAPEGDVIPQEEEPVNFFPNAGNASNAIDEDDINPLEQTEANWVGEFETDVGFAYIYNPSGVGATDGNNSNDDEDPEDNLDDPSPTTVGGLLNIDFGLDGPGDIKFDTTPTGLMSGGEPLQYWISDDGHTVVGYVVIEDGQEGSFNKIIFSAEIVDPSSGEYVFTLYGALDHPTLDGQAGDNTENNLDVVLGFTATDGNGDPAIGTLSIDVDDDLPIIDVGLDEGEVPNLVTQDADTDGDPSDTDSDSGFFSGLFSLSSQYGADGAGTLSALSYSLSVTNPNSGLSSNDLPINLYLIGGKVVGSTASVIGDVNIDNTIFDIGVNADTGEVTLTQYAEIDHLPEDVDETNDNFNIGLTAGNVILTATATITDYDGDTATDSQAIDISSYISFDDDIPGTMTAEANAVVEDEEMSGGIDEAAGVAGDPTPDYTAQVTGNVSNNGNWGADGFGSITQFQVGANTAVNVPNGGSVTVYFAQDGSYLGTNSTGAAASLLVNSTGAYTFTLLDNMLITSGQGELIDTLGTVTFTGVDGDGDTATVGLTLQVKDDIPVAVDDNALSVPEGGISTGGNVLTNDLQGADGAVVTHISLNGGTTWQLITSGTLQPDGSYLFTENNVGTYTFKADGTWTFTSVANVSGNTDASFSYRITDGDGDTDEALQPILVTDVLPSTAYITVNTSNTGGGGATGQQQFEVIITNGDTTLAKTATLQDQEGQQDIPLTFDSAVQFQEGQTYTVVLDHLSGSAHVNVTDFSITTSGGDVITLNGKGGNNNTTLIGNPDGTEDEDTSWDGVIYNITGANNVNAIQVSDPIGYDVNTVTGGDAADDGKVLVLQPALDANSDFILDFSDLPIATNGSGQTDLFGVVNKIDISGDDDGVNTNSDNTVILSAQDVLDLGSGGNHHTLFISGDGDDEIQTTSIWTSAGTVTVDGVTYDSYTAAVGPNIVTINIEQGIDKVGF